MRRLIFFLLFLQTGASFSQSKKEQIEILKSRADSLNAILANERNANSQKVQEHNSTIANLESQISSLSSALNTIKVNLTKKELENNLLNNDLNLKKQELVLLQSQLKTKTDSLKTALLASSTSNVKVSNFAQNKVDYNLEGAIGNSVSRYSYRIDGSWNGCIGDFPDCTKIPSDNDLIKAILSLKKDYNQDKIISVQDLENAVMESEDLNKDGKKDIYDLIYSFKNLIYTEDFEYFVVAKIIKHPKYDGLAMQLSESHDVYIWDPTSSSKKLDLKDNRSVVLLAGTLVDKTKYFNKTVILKGKFISGNTQAYIDGLLFFVEGIIGIVN